MIKKTDVLGIIGASSAAAAVGASVFHKDWASRIALATSNLTLFALAFTARRSEGSKVEQAEKAVRRDLREHKILIKEFRNSGIKNHRRLEKYFADLSEVISRDISFKEIGRGAANSVKSQIALSSHPENLSSSFEKLTKRVEKNHPATKNDMSAMKRRQRILFVSSNGAGLGHLTRLSAIDRKLDADTMIYTMSSAYHRLGKSTNDIIYFPSHGDLGMDGNAWNNYQEAHFGAIVKGFKPDVIVFDGTYIYRGVIRIARKQRVRLVWVQRGCWKTEVDHASKQRHNAKKICDAVIVPGDYGCVETVDLGEGMEPVYVEPITLTTSEDLLDRDEARELLGLPLDKKLFLVQLGAGVINDIDNIRATVVRTVQELGADWLPVLVRNPLSAHSEMNEVLSIQAYPLGLYYNAFDAGAFAAGYNTVQEAIELGLPGLFIPNLATKTDDQLRRANELADKGLALAATEIDEIINSVKALSRSEVRCEIQEAMAKSRRPGGAQTAANAIKELVSSWAR